MYSIYTFGKICLEIKLLGEMENGIEILSNNNY